MSSLPIDSVDEVVNGAGLPWRALVDITRPRVLFLVAFTGLPAFFVGQAASLGFGHILLVLIGTLLVGGSCSALNAVLDRDIDARMLRTRDRPLPAGIVSPAGATAFGVVLGLLGCGLLWAFGNLLTSAVGLGTIVFYVGVYTAFLKRRTAENIVIGGASGATAPLIVDAAVDGTIGPVGWILFALVFFWTPAHFWAIALYRKAEYAAAEIPMAPIVYGEQGTRIRMLVYGVLTVIVSLNPWFLEALGISYGVAAGLAGAYFIYKLTVLTFQKTDKAARSAFMASNLYLMLVFAAILARVAFLE